MQPGKLNHLFDVLDRTEVRNEAGQVKQDWVVIGQFYGGIEPVSANAFVNSGAQGSQLICRVVMRPNDFDVSPAHLLRDVDSGRIYAISGIIPVPEDNKNALMCSVGKLAP